MIDPRLTRRRLARPHSTGQRLLAATAATVLFIGSTAPALAQSAPPPADNDQLAAELGRDSITVGIAGAYVPDYDGSDDYRIVPGPLVVGSYKGFNFSVIGNRASVDLIPNRSGSAIDLQFGPVAAVAFNRSSAKSIDDARVRALGKIGATVELGGYVGIGKTGIITSPYDKLSVSLSYRHDIGGVHDSGIWQPSLTYLTPLSRKAAFGLSGSAEYAERGYATTYFSVLPSQTAASGLPAFNARKGWKNYSIQAFTTYALTGDLLHGFKLVAGGGYTRLLNDFSYSPIVRIAGSPNQWVGAVGVAYTF